jgi:hypothetical protein
MKRATLAGLIVLSLLAIPVPPPVRADQPAVTPEEAHAIAVQAYLYLYPLVTMEITREQLTNVARPEGIHAPMNTFYSFPAYPTADLKVVVRPNFDTLYSSAFLDLTKEPMIVSAPDTNGRYYMLPMLDMWTDVFASPGSRTTGTGAQNWAVVPQGWTGALPEGSDGSMRRRPTSGSSDAPRRTAPPTTTRSIRFRRGTKSRRSRAGARL